MGSLYTSGNWHVRSGSEDEFIKRWTDFVESSKDSVRGQGHFLLIREDADPKHFVSVGTWASAEARGAWMSTPQFEEAFATLGRPLRRPPGRGIHVGDERRLRARERFTHRAVGESGRISNREFREGLDAIFQVIRDS